MAKEPDETDYDKNSSKFKNSNNVKNKKEELKPNRYDFNNQIAPAGISDPYAQNNEDSEE